MKDFYPTDWMPRKLLDLYEKLIHFEDSTETAWIPQEFKLVLIQRSLGNAPRWPKTWPQIDSPSSRYRWDGVYSIFLPVSELQSYLNFKDEGITSFRIGLKEFNTELRLPFPFEEYWLK